MGAGLYAPVQGYDPNSGNYTSDGRITGSNTKFSGGMWADPNALINAIENRPGNTSGSAGSSQSNQGFGGGGGGGGIGGGGTGGIWSPGSSNGQNISWSNDNSAATNALGQAIPQAYKQSRFNTVWGSLSPLLSNFGNYRSSAPQYNVNEKQGNYPTINTSPVWSDQRLNENINADRARNTQLAQGNAAEAAGKFAGSGLGTNSPLYAALSAQLGAQAGASSSANEVDLRNKAAEANASHLLNAQTLQNQQSQDIANRGLNYEQLREKSYADARTIQAQQQNALLQALSSLAG